MLSEKLHELTYLVYFPTAKNCSHQEQQTDLGRPRAAHHWELGRLSMQFAVGKESNFQDFLFFPRHL